MAYPRMPDALLAVELLQTKVALLESRGSVSWLDAWRLGSAFSIRQRRRYTLSAVCRAWGLSRAKVYRQRAIHSQTSRLCDRILTDAALVRRLQEWISTTPFPAERYRKLWARLRHEGVAVSPERIRRLVRQHELVPKPGQGIRTSQPDQMWGIDSAKVRTALDGLIYVLIAVDHCTAECVSIDAVHQETIAAWHAVIMRAASRSRAGRPAAVAGELAIRHDNLPLFRETAFLGPLQHLGIRCSATSPLYPQGNGCAERFIRTLRENLLSQQSFADLSTVLSEVRQFRHTYNRCFLLKEWHYATPQQVRAMLQTRTHLCQ